MSEAKSSKVERSCKRCGKTFLTIPARIADGRGIYCSRQCRYAVTELDNIARFWRNVIKSEQEDGCWIWALGKSSLGYGKIKLRKREKADESTHRYSWEIHFGPIPEGLCVLHKCDNPPCVRPDHLFLGTHSDNAWDKSRKGRGNTPKGSKAGASKLTEETVLEIRRLHSEGARQRDLTRQFNLLQPNVYDIVHRKTWKHI